MTEKVIKDAGIVKGPVLLFGGVYSNLQALQALKSWAEENTYSPQNIFCTGDILGYCAQPNECIALLRRWNVRIIAGNVEINVREGKDNCGCDFNSGGRCDLFSKNWYSYIRSKVTAEEIDWIKTLAEHICFQYNHKKVTLVHGSWFNTSDFIFRSTPWKIKQDNFDACNADIIVAGHCGLPFTDEHNDKLWLNAGVIGMPANDGSNKVWFATLGDTDASLKYTFHKLSYDYKTASRLMKENGLPLSYSDTLSTGIWDNCEILPEKETSMQGKPILL